ncbi:hypothetical protein [Microbacterium lacticum]
MVEHVRRALESAGYAFVQEEPRLLALRNHRPDFLGWAPNANGELVPWAVVEFKGAARKSPELFLPQLARYRDLLGTVEHYLVINDAWFRADNGLRSLEAVDGPTPPQFGATGHLADVGLAESLLAAAHQRQLNAADRSGPFALDSLSTVIASATERGVEIAPSEYVEVARDTLFKASRRFVVSEQRRQRHAGAHSLDPTLAQAMASLLGDKLTGVVADPFAGFGASLWAVADLAESRGATVWLCGREREPSLRNLAERIARVSPVPATFEAGAELLDPMTPADGIVSVVPFGVQVRGQSGDRTLLNGEPVRDGDAAVVDSVLRSLKPGGRAVLLVPASFTFRTAGEAYRTFLAENYRVAALMTVERALEPYTSLQAVLMVIDHAAPGETFVAQLVGNWSSQLAPGGAALEAALSHIDADRRA